MRLGESNTSSNTPLHVYWLTSKVHSFHQKDTYLLIHR